MLEIDHFAFNVNRANFEKARKRYAELNLAFTIQDHHYFDSIYANQELNVNLAELSKLELLRYGRRCGQ